MGAMLGDFEELMLLAAIRLGDGATGMGIQRIINAARRESLETQGAVYRTLARMESKGWVTVRESTERRKGKPVRYITVTETGLAALQEIRRIRQEVAGSSE
jgi:DNA-binding PadR family transcriptional regulator